MENPATWGPLERTIFEALAEAGRDRAAGVIGLSTPRRIADKLRERGLVTPDDDRALNATDCSTCAAIHEGDTHVRQ